MPKFADEMEKRIEDEGQDAARNQAASQSSSSSGVNEGRGNDGLDEMPSDVSAREEEVEDSAIGGDADDVVMAVSGGRTQKAWEQTG